VSEVVLHVRIRSLSGLATCDVCKQDYSFDRAPDALESIRCPRCGSPTGELHQDLIHPVVEITEGVH
jgi:predicted amidophosphoribosyltransferase